MVYRPPDPQLLGFLEDYDRPIAELALALRALVFEEAPEALEAIYQSTVVEMWFGFDGSGKDWFCVITPYTNFVNLAFPFGAALADPKHLLQGNGKMMRHIRIESERDLERPFVRKVIRAAIEQVGEVAANGAARTVVKSSRGASKARVTRVRAQ